MARQRGKPPDWIREDTNDAVLRVRAKPGATRAGIGPVDPWRGALAVSVKAPAEGGRANEELLEVLGEALGLPPAALSIVRGERSREKEIRVRGLDADAARERLEGRR